MRPTISVGGMDITRDVQYRTAKFTSQASGLPGTCDMIVRDNDHTRAAFINGNEVTVDLGSDRVWGGYTRKVTREFPFAAQPTPDRGRRAPRYWHLEGADYNALLVQRVIYNHSDPTKGNADGEASGIHGFYYNPGAYDDTVIIDLLTNFSDLLADGISLAGVQRVGIVVFDVPGVTSGRGLPRDHWPEVAVPGYKLNDALISIARNTGAIYYIDPGKVFNYVDVDTPTSPYTLTDQPSGPFDAGYRELEILMDGAQLINDAFVWGRTLGSAKTVVSRQQDVTSIAEHGRWQGGINSAALYRQTSADALANSYINGTPTSHRGGKDNRVAFNCVVFDKPLIVAQKIRCVSAVEEFDAVYPIRRIEMTFPTPNDVRMQVVLSWEPDVPWQFAEYVYPRIDPIPITSPTLPSLEKWLYIDTFDIRAVCDPASLGIADNDRMETRPWAAPEGNG